jgi:predicted AAA+ superfamily ATPase
MTQKIKNQYIPRFFNPPAQSYFLFGPRGTGKTTWLFKNYPDAIRLDFLDPVKLREYSAHPELLIELIRGNPDKKLIIIDEVQKVPELLDVVHKLMEEKKDLQFVLTGSSARKLKRKGVDLLSGRAVLRTLHPFMSSELGDKFDLNYSLLYGMIPLIISANEPEEALRTYTALYVREEVQAEGLIRNIGGFSRFLEAVSFSHASVINVSNIARECDVERKVVSTYLDILDDLLLSFRVPVFTKRAKRKISIHPKFYLIDPGLYRSLRPSGPLDKTEEMEGVALEGLVAQHLRAWIAYTGSRDQLFFWRTVSGVEVDFVIYGDTGFLAFEVKNSRKVYSTDLGA